MVELLPAAKSCVAQEALGSCDAIHRDDRGMNADEWGWMVTYRGDIGMI